MKKGRRKKIIIEFKKCYCFICKKGRHQMHCLELERKVMRSGVWHGVSMHLHYLLYGDFTQARACQRLVEGT